MNREKINIDELDLEDIKAKLIHAESGEGWTPERVDAVETEYRRFLFLMKKFPNEETSPSVEVDTFWHYHILDTMKYAADCQKVFGYFLHHYPYVGIGDGEAARRTRERAGARMRELYEQTFATSGTRDSESIEAAAVEQADMAYCGIVGKTAYCGIGAQTAYCGIGGSAADAMRADAGIADRCKAQNSYCGVTASTRPNRRAGNSYCGVTPGFTYRGEGHLPVAGDNARQSAYCGVVGAIMPNATRSRPEWAA